MTRPSFTVITVITVDTVTSLYIFSKFRKFLDNWLHVQLYYMVTKPNNNTKKFYLAYNITVPLAANLDSI